MRTASQLHRTMFSAIQDRDFDGLRRIFGPGSVHMSGDGIERPAPDSVVDEVRMFTTAFPDLAFDFRHQHAWTDSVSVIEYTFSGTHHGPLGALPATGRRISVVACSILESRDGMIVREADYYDTLAVMSQLEQ